MEQAPRNGLDRSNQPAGSIPERAAEPGDEIAELDPGIAGPRPVPFSLQEWDNLMRKVQHENRVYWQGLEDN